MLPDAYFAGHFDGEGCIRLTKHHRGYRPWVAVTNSHQPIIDLYRERFGGSIREKPKASTNKLLSEWYLVTHDKCLYFVDAVLPFSMEKKPQLLVLKKWLEERKLEKRVITQEFIDYSFNSASKLAELKKECNPPRKHQPAILFAT